MRIETIAIDQIAASSYNPRKDLQPTDPEYIALERSLARWDAVEPLIWNARSGNLVGGHQRLKILKARGDTEVAVSVVDLDEADEIALNVALNKTGGTWDDRKLFDVLSVLEGGPVDFTLTGFSPDDLAGLAAALDAAPPLFVPTAANDVTAVPVTSDDVLASQTKIDERFEKKPGKVKDVMCPHCGHSFGLQTK